MIKSISNFVESPAVKEALDKYFQIRETALDMCAIIPGYNKASRQDKLFVYDAIRGKLMEVEGI